MKKNKLPWIMTVSVAILVVVLSFTPLVIPIEKYKPMLFGIPYSLWVGILVTIIMVVLTYVATRVHPGSNKEIANKNNTTVL